MGEVVGVGVGEEVAELPLGRESISIENDN